MKKIIKNSLLLLFLFNLVFVPVKAIAMENTSYKDDSCSKAAYDLKMAERKLWIDHVLWTRSFIVSDLASLEDKEPVLERLLKNQDDIGDSIKPYYGQEAGNKLAALLKDHIKLAGQVVDAAKSGDKKNLEKYTKLWYENADEIANFLSSANPKYSNKVLKDMLHRHLQLVTAQAVSRLNKDWKKDIEAFDEGEDHMIKFADILAEGIIRQFPQKFK
ncbi:glycosyltransferase [Clostridium sardiniense]|uniref:glycosyltransferase n=1 Tax=Clostridium sardiniense TaxID=29369 RepID=UPI003D341F51